ncbi:ADP-ribosylglycohydrolase family protein [Serpentinicella alkaliphila]|uniref:ADP-ribosylglycohydrolase n=1 Tax=Serpentinicella alkaliphila TaxID=1734049 RepID=A0A4R2TJ89_9FIRM|nr:ADP-ribosylglycohydrolase family protein [Serpentinicella alkaliphila]QUH24711.1 ADP-ribosylglycohydrolase family protein [Serpentinicella alkaliphila]TCQ03700.1 ADP-ribosylglycohydrolase [Serpentinicella alkaliphila]
MYLELLEQLYSFLINEIHMPKFSNLIEKNNLVPKSNIDYLDKIRGAFVGLALGDAFGNFIEGQNSSEIDYVLNLFKSDKHSISLDVSDDTEMTILFSESLIINQGFNPEDIANRFIRQPITRTGKTINEFIINYRDRKLEWYKSGVESAGNGAAMRCAPVSFLNYGDYNSLKLMAGIQSTITHVDQMAIASSIALSYSIAYLMNLEPFSIKESEQINDLISAVGDSIKGIETSVYRSRTEDEIENLYTRINIVLPKIIKQQEDMDKVKMKWGSSAYVLESLPYALYAFLKQPNDFEQILNNCIGADDTDTVTSMALTLAGAYIGFKNIHKVYVKKLRNLEEILTLSDRLFELSIKNKLNNPYRRMRDQIRTNNDSPENLQDELDQLIWMAIKHTKQEQFELAVKYFELLIEKNPEFKKNEKLKTNIIEAYEGLGNRFLEKGQFEEALKYFKKALEHDLNHPSILCNLAITYLNLDDLNKAERYSRRAVELAPDFKIGKEVLNAVKSLNKEK